MANVVCLDRASQYPRGALRVTDGKLFCSTCQIPLDYSMKSRIDDHIQSQLHRDIMNGRVVSSTAQQILKRANAAMASTVETFEGSLAKAFRAADIPLTEVENEALVEYLSGKVDDVTSLRSAESLLYYYQKYVSDTIKEPVFCTVVGCRTWCNSTQYTIFPFPECRETHKLWRQALGAVQCGFNRKLYGLCELHFEEDFLVKENDSTALMPGAVPKAIDAPEPEPKPAAPVVPRAASARENVPLALCCRMCGTHESKLTSKTNSLLSDLLKDEITRSVLNICLDLRYVLHSKVCEGCVSMVKFISNFVKTCKKAEAKMLLRDIKNNRTYQTNTINDIDEVPAMEYVGLPEEEVDTAGSSNSPMAVQQEPIDLLEPDLAAVPIKIEQVAHVKDEECSDEEQPFLTNETVKVEPEAAIVSAAVSDISAPPVEKRRRLEVAPNNIECKICGQKFTTLTMLNLHTRQHTAQSIEKQRIKQLMESTGLNIFKCLYCRHEFSTVQKLRAHCDQQHSEVKCDSCDKKFKNKSVLAKHKLNSGPCQAAENSVKSEQ